MSGRPSAATLRALGLIGKPKKGGGKYTAYSAAKECGIALSTVYRALARPATFEEMNEWARRYEAQYKKPNPIFSKRYARLK